MDNVYVKFGEGCLGISFTTESIVINGIKLNIEVRPRMVIIHGVKDVNISQIYQHRKKVIYIHHEGEPYKNYYCGNNVYTEYSAPVFSLKYTELNVGKYITMILSPTFLIDYLVISDNIVVLIIPGKRKVFVDTSKNTTSLYIV
ncbi:MAG: hypothetical protein QXU13_00015 [Desulfurococcaceae archaeon]